jgi:hypothetical protein
MSLCISSPPFQQAPRPTNLSSRLVPSNDDDADDGDDDDDDDDDDVTIRGLRRGLAAARLLGLWVRIPPGAWMSISCKCRVLSGSGLCDGLITRPEEPYRLWCV